MSTLVTQNLKDATTDKSVDMSNITDGTAKVWANFNGTGTIAIRDSFNSSSLTDNGTGDYSVNLTNNMSDVNYGIQVSTNQAACYVANADPGAGTFRFTVANTSFVASDANYNHGLVHGDLA